jgi:iron complex outermembrane receptor protein
MLGREVDVAPGLQWQAWLVAEGDRTLLPVADSPRIGGWARLDLAARYVQALGGTTLTWRAGVENVADRRAWKEAPLQFGHVWLYPLAPRTFRVSLQADL